MSPNPPPPAPPPPAPAVLDGHQFVRPPHLGYREQFQTKVENASAFLGRAKANRAARPRSMCDLLPSGAITVIEGPSRFMNSLAATDLAISTATGTGPFGLSRLAMPPQPVLLCSELLPEDLLADRVLRMCRARQLSQPPELLFIKTLADCPEQSVDHFMSNSVVGVGLKQAIRLVILESAHLKPVEESDLFAGGNLGHMLQLPRRLGACVVLVCWTSNRKAYASRYKHSGPHAYASATLRVEPKGPTSFSLVPYGYIGGNDPQRVAVEVVSASSPRGETLELLAHSRGVRLAVEELEAKVLAALVEGPAESRTKLYEKVGGKKDSLLNVVDRLIDQGKIECEPRGSSHRLTLAQPSDSTA